MSLLSRLLRKAPTAPEPAATPQPSPPVAQPIAAPSVDEEAELRRALEINDIASVARWVVEGSTSKVRQLAAQAIDDPAQIKRLLREAGGRDKNVYKILRQKNDVILSRERAATQMREEFEAAAAAIERHSRRIFDPLFTPTLEQLEARWKPLRENAPESLQRQVQENVERCHETIALHLRQVAAQAARELAEANAAAAAQLERERADAEAVAFAAQAAAEAEAQKKALDEKRAAEAQAIQRISGLIGKARGALKDGNSGRAAGLRKAIEEALANAPPLPPHLSRQIQDLDDRLNELKDWKSYAAAPKRLELIERMEKLIGVDRPPRELADEIKLLQSQWKTVSRGVAEESDQDWERFHTAAQAAYQPCKVFFADQAREREENLERRRDILQRLAAFESSQNWQQPDWRLVTTVLREAPREWRMASPVEREAGSAVQESFDATIAGLQTRLDEEHARNLKLKRNLIARAKHFLAATDARKAVDEIKQLQLKWKGVGITPRGEDSALWEEFRQQCNAVFQRDQEKRSAQIAELRAKKAEETALRAELEEAAKQYGTDSSDNGKFSQLQSAFDSLRDAKP